MKKAIGILVVLLAVGGAGFTYWYLGIRVPEPQVSLTVTKPDRTLLGEPFEITVSYRNDSVQVLRNAKLVIVLPDNVAALGESPDRRVIEQNQGDLGPGLGNLGTFRFVATGEAQSLAQFEARLRYSVTDDSGSQIETKTVVDVGVGGPAATLTLAAPERAVAGEPFTVTADYRNDSKMSLENVKVKVAHPDNFQLRSTEPLGNGREWTVGTLVPSATGTVALTGSGVDPTTKIEFSLEAEFEGRSYVISKQTAEVRITPALLSLEIYANGKGDHVAEPGERLNYELRYKNNSGIELRDVSIEAALSGSLFDYRELDTRGGVFDSVKNTVRWDPTSVPELASLAPNAEGLVQVSIYLKRDIVLRRLGDKHFSVKIKGTIQSPTVPAGVSGTKTSGLASLETKVQGKIELQTLAMFYDSASGIANKGPFPPKVNTATQFTVHWKIKNYWNDVSDIKVSAKLGPGVRFTGTVKSTAGTNPVYNAATGEVIWEVPKIVATQGVLSKPPEAIFQIEITPAVNQIGRSLSLLEKSTLRADDDFTGLALGSETEGKTTDLRDDPKASALGRGEVIP